MDKVANASINSFGISSKADAPPEESIFVLTSSQLRRIVAQAVQDAPQPLQDEVLQLRATVARQDEKIASLEATQEAEISRVCVDIAYDRQRIAKLERIEPQPMQKDRGEILRALIAANGGKMLAKEARQKMRMDKGNFSRLLDTLEDYIEKKPLHQDKRNLVLKLVVHNQQLI